MSKTEILIYAPLSLDAFVDFFKNGITKPGTIEPAIDDHDRFVTGGLNWLHGRGVTQGKFYASVPGAPFELFMAIIEAPEQVDVPWMSDLPGFKKLVRTDGIFGTTTDFAAALGADMAGPLKLVGPRPDLDELFAMGVNKIAKIDFQKSNLTKEMLLQALMGTPGTDLQKVLSKISSRLSLINLVVTP